LFRPKQSSAEFHPDAVAAAFYYPYLLFASSFSSFASVEKITKSIKYKLLQLNSGILPAYKIELQFTCGGLI
jgi:hypothetical protein